MRNETPTGNTVDVRELASPDARSIASGVLGALAIAVFYLIGAKDATIVVSLVGLASIVTWGIVQIRRASYSRAPEKSEIATKPIIWAAVGGLTTFAIAWVVDLLTSGFDALVGIPVFIRLIIFALVLVLLAYLGWQTRNNVQYKRSEITTLKGNIDQLGSSVRRSQDAIIEILDGDRDGRYSRANRDGIRTAYLGGEYYYLSVAGWKRGSAPEQGKETQERPAPIIERLQAPVRRTDQTMVGFDEQQPYGTGDRGEHTQFGVPLPTPPQGFTAPEPESERDVNGVTVTTDGTQFRGRDDQWYPMPYGRLDNDRRPWNMIPDEHGNLPTTQTPYPPQRDEEAPGVGELPPRPGGRRRREDTTGTRLDLGTPGAQDGPPAV